MTRHNPEQETAMNLLDRVQRELKRHLIGRQITCPITREVLDIRTAEFVLDADGDPVAAYSPGGRARLEALAEEHGAAQVLRDDLRWEHERTEAPETLPADVRDALDDILED